MAAAKKFNARAFTHVEHGFACMEKKEFTSAVEQFTRALMADPQHFEALYNRAMCYLSLKQLAEAETDLIACSNIDPEYGETWLRLAQTQQQLKKFDECLATARTCMEKAWDSVHYVTGAWIRSEIFESRGKNSEAIECLQQVVTKNPYAFEAYEKMLTLLEKEGRETEAEATDRQMQQFQALGHKLDVALEYFQNENYPEAEKIYNEVLKVDVQNSEALCNRGQIHASRNDFARALADYEIILKNNPKNAKMWFLTGHTCAQAGQKAKAKAAYEKVYEIDPAAESEMKRYIDKLK